MKDEAQNLALQDLDPEVRAYLYQQVVDFEPYALPDSKLSFSVEEFEQDGEKIFSVTLMLTGGGTYIKATQESSDIFEATSMAKQAILERIFAALDKVQQRDEAKSELVEDDEDPKLHQVH